jgi:FHA domain
MVSLTCSKCGTPSQANQVVCAKCGALLFDPSASTVHIRIDPMMLRLHRARQEEKLAAAIPARTVLLQIRGLSDKLVFEEGTETVLGRLDLNQPTAPRFDLTRFGAHERGVSREHALLRFKDDQLTITDLDSVNGTTVNLKRLAPNEPLVLADGDEIMLGTLSIVLRFETAPAPQKPDEMDDITWPTRDILAAEGSKPVATMGETLLTNLLDSDITPPLGNTPPGAQPANEPKADPGSKVATKELEKMQANVSAPANDQPVTPAPAAPAVPPAPDVAMSGKA